MAYSEGNICGVALKFFWKRRKRIIKIKNISTKPPLKNPTATRRSSNFKPPKFLKKPPQVFNPKPYHPKYSKLTQTTTKYLNHPTRHPKHPNHPTRHPKHPTRHPKHPNHPTRHPKHPTRHPKHPNHPTRHPKHPTRHPKHSNHPTRHRIAEVTQQQRVYGGETQGGRSGHVVPVAQALQRNLGSLGAQDPAWKPKLHGSMG